MARKRITILGATGSIGQSALDVAARHPDRFEIVGLAAGGNDRALAEQVARFRPQMAALGDPEAAARLAKQAGTTAVRSGPEGLAEVAALPADLVIAGIVGSAGPLLMVAAARHGVRLLPIDSEHSAIFQCLEGHRREDLEHIVLTASGGPFRHTPMRALAAVTPAEAARHPNWDMGPKITVDSATLMNKGLEVIEARWLFGVAPERIRVVVHPESIVHSMVAYRDGSVIAQLGLPDMRAPIAYAMAYPERVETDVAPPDFVKLGALTFEPPDTERFPCLSLAYRAAAGCGTLPAVLNAANEVAVAAFLAGSIGFTDIPRVVAETLDAHVPAQLRSLEQVLAADAWARQHATARLGARAAAGAGHTP
jgi:1-deoxy-D-xylulose-5-phosphate reductoisomerase